MARFRVVSNAHRVAERFRRGAGIVGDEERLTVRLVANHAVLIFRRFAPRRTGRLRRGVRAHVHGSSATITANAVDPRSGFDYVGVTRFGHRVAIIRPRRARALGPIPGIGFRRFVRGYRPRGDWRDRALPAIERQAESSLRLAGVRIVARF